MILSSLCATSGIIMGILAFAQQPTFTRLSRPFPTGIMFFASGEWTRPTLSLSLLPALPQPQPIPTPNTTLIPDSSLSTLPPPDPHPNPTTNTNTQAVSNSTYLDIAIQFWH